jgi:hypothetical protein
VAMSFPVFWEYSFKAALKIAWNGEDEGEFEDIVLDHCWYKDKMDTVEGRDQNVFGGCLCAHGGLYMFTLPQIPLPQIHQGNIRKTEARLTLSLTVTVDRVFIPRVFPFWTERPIATERPISTDFAGHVKQI